MTATEQIEALELKIEKLREARKSQYIHFEMWTTEMFEIEEQIDLDLDLFCSILNDLKESLSNEFDYIKSQY
jgi:hypothetical protein